MELKNFTYLLLMLALIIVPVVHSIKNGVGFYSKLKYLLPAILFSGAIFILWDIRFEELGIWQFNPEYISGIYFMNLPLSEWLYFLAIPFYAVYIYEVLKIKLPDFEKDNLFVAISLVLLVAFALIAYFGRTQLYTFFTFFLLSIYFGYTVFRNRFKKHYTKFYLAYFFSLVPFLIVSGILTALPVIKYNEEHILGLHIFTIPVENLAVFFLLLLMNITIYEYLKQQRFY